MKTQHKYFRNQQYKEKLKRKVDSQRHGFTYYKVITKEPPTNILIEFNYRHGEYGVERYWCKSHYRYEFWDLKVVPDVPYTVLKIHSSHKGNSYRTYLKRYRNRQFRHNKEFVSSNRNIHHRMYEYWWDID